MIENHIKEHFKPLFNQVSILNKDDLIEETIPYLVNDHINNMLTNLPSTKEINKAVMNLNGDTAPGPYGF